MSTQAVDAEKLDRHECLVCGYIYEPAKGDSKSQILSGTSFEELPSGWHCPVCGASTTQFRNVGPQGKPSGFEENLRYGFGVNTLTPGQKNLLIFGALGIGFVILLSLYGLQ
ncbi:MAG TPA: rubredoxin [Candidatus Caenarcaniphilales bacterium]